MHRNSSFSSRFCLQVFTFILTILFPATGLLKAQVLINEIQASNISTVSDQFGEYDDWIELYNAGNSEVNLNGYGLTDDITKPFLFKFPATSIPAKSYMIVFAADTNITNVNSHWETAINSNTSWSYRVNTTSPPDTNWRNLSFNDSWSTGTGGIGYGDGDDGTTISTCVSSYLRKTFTVSDTSKITASILNVDYDDSFVAYLNGVEIARANIGVAGQRPSWNAVSVATHEALMYQGGKPDSFYIDNTLLKSILKNGTNVLALEVHNQSSTNVDMTCRPWLSFLVKDEVNFFGPVPSFFISPSKQYLHAGFKLSRSGESIYLLNSAGTILDQKSTGVLEANNSLGRNPDGSSNWCLIGTPSPNASNNSASCASGYTSSPVFSLSGGFYGSSQILSLSSTYPGGQIRYSIDGSEVSSSSSLYTGALHIDTTVTVRAAVFASNALSGPAVTNTYFIKEQTKLPVFSLTTDPVNLWDYNTGIFVKGPNAGASNPYWGANFWQDWEKPITLEYYDRSKNRAFRFNSGMKITGGWSRSAEQKSMEIMLGDKYGQSKLNYPLEESVKPWLDKWDDFILHTTGNDRNQCKMRDPLMNRLLKGTNNDFLAYEPCLVFINGQNWGVYYVRENDDHHWIESNYGYKKDEVDLLKESYFYNGIEVKKGSDSAFFAMHEYAMNTSPSNPAFYNTMSSMMDLENMADYFIAETYYPNDDWMGGSNNNLKLWRPRKEGGKFRYLIYDLDFGLGYSGTVTNNMLSVARNASPHNYNSDLFKVLTNNTTYKRYFINRYADLMNTIFLPSSIESMISLYRDSLKHDMHYQWEAWGGDSANWVSKMNSMITFANQRPANARNFVQNEFGLSGQVTLTIQASPAGAGRIQISTITPGTLPWTGVYFNGNPVTITAIPNPGYSFDHWKSNVVINQNNYNQSATINFTSNDVITCYFSGSSAPLNVAFSEINYNSKNTADAGDWIELKNSASYTLNLSEWMFKDEDDQHIYKFPIGTTMAPGAYLVLASDLEKFSSRFPNVQNVVGDFGFDFSNSGENLRLFDHKGILVQAVYYQDQLPWPVAADGQGYTLEIKNISQPANVGSNWFAGCLEGSPGRTFTGPNVSLSSVGSVSFCQGDSLNLQVAASSSAIYQWKRNNVNIHQASDASYTISTAGVYHVEVSDNGCSAISDSVQVTVLNIEQVSTVTSAERCDSGPVVLTATGTSSLNWFDSMSGGTQLASGATFTTPSLNQSTTYYVAASGVCTGPRQAVEAIILPRTAVPQVQNSERCGPGDITLRSNDTLPIRWYDSSIGGTLLANGSDLNISALQQSEVFYVEAGSQCPSARIAVNAIIKSLTPDPVANDVLNCGPASISISVSDTNTIRWYDSISGGNLLLTGNTFITPVIYQTTTYYVSAGDVCPSNRMAVQAIIEDISPDPIVADVHRCGTGVVTFNALSPDPVRWYNAIGGTMLFSGNTYSSQSLSSNTIYYLQAGVNCPSAWVSVEAVIDEVSTVPIVSDAQRCGPGSVSLNAQAVDPVSWYDAIGGNVIFSGNTFNTSFLNSSTTFYVQSGITCPSSWVSAHVTIDNITTDPIVSDVHRCGPGTVAINAISAGTVNWYDAVGGNLLSTGNTFNSPVLNNNTSYYLQAGSICPSAIVSVQVLIDEISADPEVSDGSICGEGSVILSATSNSIVFWYDTVSGNVIGSGNTFVSPFILADEVYYARAGQDCPSNFVAVNAIVHSLPIPVLGNDTMISSGSQLMLDPGQNFVAYLWSDGSTASTLNVNTEGTYVVTVTDLNSCLASDTISIMLNAGIGSSRKLTTFSIYPNPARSQVSIRLADSDKEGIIKLVDVSGRIVKQIYKRAGLNEVQIEIEGIASGVYQIQYTSAEGSANRSLMIE